MKKLPAFTLVEEEYQIIDPETRDLRSHLSKIVDGAKVILNEQVKAEMHQSVEVGTNICMNVNEAEKN
jgi:carboxylate-amine ligase